VRSCRRLIRDIDAVLAGELTAEQKRRQQSKGSIRHRAPKPNRVTLRFL